MLGFVVKFFSKTTGLTFGCRHGSNNIGDAGGWGTPAKRNLLCDRGGCGDRVTIVGKRKRPFGPRMSKKHSSSITTEINGRLWEWGSGRR